MSEVQPSSEVTPGELNEVGAPPPKPWPVSVTTLLREVVETILLTAIIYFGVNFATGRFRIESISMQPNLQPGEYVLVDKISYMLGQPERGEVVVFHHPLGERDLIKRIIGLPGETIEINNGVVSVNGQALDEPYIAAPPANGGSWTLGPDQFFVMGDNRNNSSDSRSWGPLDRKHIIGKAVFVYWPPTMWGVMPDYTYASSN